MSQRLHARRADLKGFMREKNDALPCGRVSHEVENKWRVAGSGELLSQYASFKPACLHGTIEVTL